LKATRVAGRGKGIFSELVDQAPSGAHDETHLARLPSEKPFGEVPEFL
jgi:hypothetical protein